MIVFTAIGQITVVLLALVGFIWIAGAIIDRLEK